VIRYKPTGSTSYTYQSIGNSPVSAASWSTGAAIFTVPAGIESLTIFHLISSVGWLTVDDYSLTKNPDPVSFSQGMVSLDFDDGWLSTFTNGIPILNEKLFPDITESNGRFNIAKIKTRIIIISNPEVVIELILKYLNLLLPTSFSFSPIYTYFINLF
jgi:hypothetical protein